MSRVSPQHWYRIDGPMLTRYVVWLLKNARRYSWGQCNHVRLILYLTDAQAQELYGRTWMEYRTERRGASQAHPIYGLDPDSQR